MSNYYFNFYPQRSTSSREQIIGRARRISSQSNIPIRFLYYNIIESKPTNYIKPINYVENLECCICIGSYESHEYCEISCSHKFHFYCMSQWIKTKINNQSTITCPYCREELKKIEKIPEHNEE